jgi:signal transduction histidine kinase
MRAPSAILIATLLFFSGSPATLHAAPAEWPPAALTNAAQIRKLSAAQAARAIPATLRGVVVDESEPREHAVILADQTASLYLVAATNLFAPYHRTDLLEIRGVTSQGAYAPCVLATEVKKLGNAPVPAARPVTYQQLLTGALDAQFVEITGVVRECWPAAPGDHTWRIVLAANGGAIPVRILLPQNPQIQVDAEVTIQAVCLYEFNNKRQALSPVLQVPHGLWVSIVRRPPESPFESPVQSLSSLLQFSSEIPYGHRIHVRGTVTSTQPGSLVWIRDESSSLRVQTGQGDKLSPGDEVEVLGFPGYGSSTPVLEDAIYRKTGTSTPPTPLVLADASVAYDHQDDLVSVNGTLIELRPEVGALALTLEQSNTTFKVVLKQPLAAQARPAWQPGSVVRAVGICDVIYDNSKPVMGIWHPASFQILLRSPADLTVLKTPPWWNARHVMLLLGLFASGSLMASGAVMLLARRRLNEQARRQAMAEAEFAAILAERNRLAREIHDTLAQGYTAALLQLELVKFHAAGDHHAMDQHLGTAQQMIRASLKEARLSIWQMQPQVLESSDLAGALRNILHQLADGIIPQTRFDVTGRARRLSPAIESHILRLGQEAITNAVKHSRAQHLGVTLEFEETQFVLSVVDDGCGFDPAHPPPSEGGFGLVGMQGRAVDLSGQLKIRTAPGQGTEVCLSVSLAPEPNSPRTG